MFARTLLFLLALPVIAEHALASAIDSPRSVRIIERTTHQVLATGKTYKETIEDAISAGRSLENACLADLDLTALNIAPTSMRLCVDEIRSRSRFEHDEEVYSFLNAMANASGFVLDAMSTIPTETSDPIKKRLWTLLQEIQPFIDFAALLPRPGSPPIFRGADFRCADLRYADLLFADLRNADFGSANLNGASLKGADLRSSILRHAHLANTKLEYADLSGTLFQASELPPADSLAYARGLDRLKYVMPEGTSSSYALLFVPKPSALMEMRKQLRDAGFRNAASALTCSIERERNFLRRQGCLPGFSEESLVGKLKQILLVPTSYQRMYSFVWWGFHFVFFDLTSAYGSHPVRPLAILVYLVLLCTPFYALVVLDRKYGLVEVSLRPVSGHFRPVFRTPVRKGRFQKVRVMIRALSIGLYFSDLMSFRIGFREFNLGYFIELVRKREAAFRAQGLARVVAGVQSAASIYLFALWILAYFGKPFG